MTAAAMARARGWVTATAAAWAEARAKGQVSATASVTAVAMAAARVAGVGVGDSGGDGSSERGQYPRDARGLRCPRAPARGRQRRQKVCQFWRRGRGGGGGGRGTGGRMIIDPRSVHAAIDKEDVRGRGRKWNGLKFKRLGKVRVIIYLEEPGQGGQPT